MNRLQSKAHRAGAKNTGHHFSSRETAVSMVSSTKMTVLGRCRKVRKAAVRRLSFKGASNRPNRGNSQHRIPKGTTRAMS